MASSVNDRLQDETIAHGLYVTRYGTGVARRMVALLSKMDADLAARLMVLLDGKRADTYSARRLASLLAGVRDLNQQAYEPVNATLARELTRYVEYEVGYQFDLFSSIIPKQILRHVPLQSIAPEQVYASAVAQPFQGRLLKEWGQKLETDRLDKITNAVRTGFLQGETVEQIVKRVAGTPQLNRQDGVINASRRDLAVVARTAVNHMAATARQEFAQANSDIVKAKQWSSTLDTHTSHQCFVPETTVETLGDASHLTVRKYRGLIHAVTTASGNQLKGTPNHPVLTPDGWRPLGEIKPGEQVFQAISGSAAIIESAKDVTVVAKFSDFLDSRGKPAVGKIFVEGSSATQFHGDGMVGENEVNISRLASDLRDDCQSRRDEAVIKYLLGIGESRVSLTRGENLFFTLLRKWCASLPAKSDACAFKRLVNEAFAAASTRFSEKDRDYFERLSAIVEQLNNTSSITIYEGVLLASSEDWHSPSLCEQPGERGSRAAILFSQVNCGSSCLVFGDDVARVTSEFGSYHVCNLHTDSELYIAGGVIVHNCIIRDRKLYTLDGKPLGHAIPYLRGPGKIHFCCRSCEILITKSWEEMQIASGELSSATRASMDGQVPAHTSYAEWLARQPYARQEQVLGVTRAQMLRDGKITVPEMFNDAGEFLTLDELRRVDASAFEG